jgi:hypothetical protein
VSGAAGSDGLRIGAFLEARAAEAGVVPSAVTLC